MYVINIIPLSKLPRGQAGILTYFYDQLLSRGVVVEAPFNRRKIIGVVLNSTPIKTLKLTVKKNIDYELKNILRILYPNPQVSHLQLQIANEIAAYYYTSLGLALKTVLPPFFGKRGYDVSLLADQTRGQSQQSSFQFLPTNLTNHSDDYKKIIREKLRAGYQVFLLVPENISAKYFFKQFTDFDPFLISSAVSNKNYYGIWNGVNNCKIKFVIGTRVGLFLPFKKLGLIIIDDEASEAYKSDMNPRYNAADLALSVARFYSADVLINAIIPRLETSAMMKLTDGSKIGLSSTEKKPVQIVDMVHELKLGNFSIFSREVLARLTDFIASGKNFAIFVPRRGFSNYVLCQNCGTIIKCPHCAVSLIPHLLNSSKTTETDLRCHHCGYHEQRPKVCLNCGGYRLKAYGLGTEKVINELNKHFNRSTLKPSALNLLQLDSDAVKDETDEVKIIDTFNHNRYCILVASQMIFSYKYLISPALIVIMNADALAPAPDFRGQEQLFRQIATLREIGREMIVQTYNPTDATLKYGVDGLVNNFFSAELDNRLDYGYPPYSKLVKLLYRHKNFNQAKKEAIILAEKIRYLLSRHITSSIEMLGPTASFISKERGQYAWQIILRIKKTGDAIDLKTRDEVLRLVPNGWIIDIDPKNII